MRQEPTLRLHLGCGQRRFEGYRNIDFPQEEHSVQSRVVADETADLRTLRYPAGSVAEVRLHHVFEHFPRPQAAALVACWQSWLCDGGLLRLEVPDFDRTARAALLPWTGPKAKAVAIRHLFGSHEAPWAAHWEGWHRGSLRALLEGMGFEGLRFSRNQWLGTHNIEVTARKVRDADPETAAAGGRAFFADYLVDQGESETRLLAVWMAMFQDQVRAAWAL